MEFLRDREAFSRLANKASLAARDNWYDIRTQGDEEVTVYIYSEIGFIGATAEEFIAEMRDITTPTIRVRINSYGGSFYDALAIYNAIRTHPSHVVTQVDGIAASAASIITQAGDRRIMVEHSQMVIHEAHGIAVGATAKDMRELAEVLERVTDDCAGIYAAHSGGRGAKKHFLSLMRSRDNNMGALLSDSEAVAEGLADEVLKPPKKASPAAKIPEPDPEPVETTPAVDFSDLFDADDYEWSFDDQKEKTA